MQFWHLISQTVRYLQTAQISLFPKSLPLEDAQEEFTTEDVQDAFAAEAQQGEAYVLMNIPYDDFYKAELKNNDVKVRCFHICNS